MINHLELQEINQLHKGVSYNTRSLEAALYNHLKFSQKLEVPYTKNLYYDNLENTNLTDTALTNAIFEDGAMFLDPKDISYADNGTVLEASTLFTSLQVAKNGSVYALYEEKEGNITVKYQQNGLIFRVLDTFAGTNPHIAQTPSGFVIGYDRLDETSGLQRVYYRTLDLVGNASNEVLVNGTATYSIQKPRLYCRNADIYVFYETLENGTPNIAFTLGDTHTPITTKATECNNPRVAEITQLGKVAVIYEDIEFGFTQLCYKFLDDLATEHRITTENKTQKECQVLSGPDAITLISVSDMENNYLSPTKTTISSTSTANVLLAPVASDAVKPTITINGEGRETAYWLEDGILHISYEGTSEVLGPVNDYAVMGDTLQNLFILTGALTYKHFDTVENREGTLYTLSPDSAALFYSQPVQLNGDYNVIDLYISKIGDEIKVKPYVSFTNWEDFIPLEHIDDRLLIQNTEEHWQLRGLEGQTVRVKFELTTTNKYSTSQIIDYGFTFY